MNEEKSKKLGRGLSSLLSGKSFLGDSSFTEAMSNQINIGITKIIPNKKQIRKNFNKEELENLASSIKEKGIIQPILVRKKPDEDSYEIVAGERRWRAAQIAELHSIPVIIKKYSDQEVIEVGLIENIQRENLNPVEEANAYQSLSNEYNYKQEQLSKIIGKSRSHIANMMRLLELPEFILNLLKAEKITIGHARPLIGLSNAEELVKKIINNKLNVRQSEKLAYGQKKQKIKRGFSIIDPNIKDLENELSEKIGLKTSIKFSDKSTSGSITVYYSNLEQLDDIMKRLKKN